VVADFLLNSIFLILIDLLLIVFIVIDYKIKPKLSLSLVADERENGHNGQPKLPEGRIL
jgi:hypothetical protein